MTDAGITRRHTLTGAAVVGVGVPFLAACGTTAARPIPLPVRAAPPASRPRSRPARPSRRRQREPAADALTSTGEVPEGGGTIFANEQVVVTQPTAGEFKCFTAVCTHQGCVVSSVEGGSINCACHGSAFSIADGSVENGPATSPLAEVADLRAGEGDQPR